MAGVDYVTAGQETTGAAPIQKGRIPKSSDLRKRDLATLAQLEGERTTWDKKNRDIGELLLPNRFRPYATQTNNGGVARTRIRDSHGSYTLRTAAAGMNSGMTSAARPWFDMASPDEDKNKRPNVRAWCEDVTQRLRNQLLRTNWYQTLPSVYYDILGFGTGVVASVEDDETIARYYSYPVGTWCLAANDRGNIDTFLRRLRMTPQQLVAKFGEANVSDNCKSLCRQGTRTWLDVLWVVCPNESYDPSRALAPFKRFRSTWWEIGHSDGAPLRSSGFDRFPILTARWEVTGEDVYGSGQPGELMLPDVKELQEVVRKASRALEKGVDPPMLAPASARDRLSLMSGDVNTVANPTDEKGYRALHEIRFDIDHANQKIADLRSQISRGGFEDLFRMLSSPSMDGDPRKTAREVAELHEEKLTALGPVLNQMNGGFLSEAIEGLFEHMRAYGAIPPPPDEIAGQPLKVEFVSVLAQAQKLVDINGIERAWGFTAQLIEAGVQEAGDVLKTDDLQREYYDRVGVDSTLVRNDDELAELRQARAKQLQAQQQAETAALTAKATRDLANSPTDGKTALSDILGGPVPGQAVA